MIDQRFEHCRYSLSIILLLFSCYKTKLSLDTLSQKRNACIYNFSIHLRWYLLHHTHLNPRTTTAFFVKWRNSNFYWNCLDIKLKQSDVNVIRFRYLEIFDNKYLFVSSRKKGRFVCMIGQVFYWTVYPLRILAAMLR